nr:MAG TPA: hypothetical protein [Caudoviricetes sp.]
MFFGVDSVVITLVSRKCFTAVRTWSTVREVARAIFDNEDTNDPRFMVVPFHFLSVQFAINNMYRKTLLVFTSCHHSHSRKDRYNFI